MEQQTELSINDLKVLAYDKIGEIEQVMKQIIPFQQQIEKLQRELSEINIEISKNSIIK